MSYESEGSGNAPKDKRALNLQSHIVKVRQQDIKHQLAVNESINTLLSVVKYLNAVQDGDALRIEGTYCKTDIDKPSRILNCHEEDIMNASLITMKRLIESLCPSSSRVIRSHDDAAETSTLIGQGAHDPRES